MDPNPAEQQLVVRYSSLLERARFLPFAIQNWEDSVMARLNRVHIEDPLDRKFLELNLLQNELSVIQSCYLKLMMKYFGAVGSAHAFDADPKTLSVTMHAETEMMPEKLAMRTVEKLSDDKRGRFSEGFDEFVVLRLQNEGQKLSPPVDLTRLAIELAFEQFDQRVKNPRQLYIVTHTLERSGHHELPYGPLSDADQTLYNFLQPLTVPEHEFDAAYKPTSFPVSLSCSLKYVYHKTAYFLMQTLYKYPFPDDVTPVVSHQKYPSELDKDIQNYFEESPFSREQHIRHQQLDTYAHLLKYIGAGLNQGPGNVMHFYMLEKFNDGSLAKLFDYPGLNTLL